jgi:3-dehydroquinate dehydratase-1
MLELGSLELGRVPRIAVPFSDAAQELAISDAARNGLDIAEIRVDKFSQVGARYVRSVLPRFRHLPTIATVRAQREGGSWEGTEADRLSLYLDILPDVDAVDVELAASEVLPVVANAVRSSQKLLIVSYHDFVGTPDTARLGQIANDAVAAGADIVKIAALPANRADLHALAAFCCNHADKHLIVIGMGGCGLPTRLLWPALGSLVTFASIGEPMAPGQLPFEEMFGLMRKLYPEFDDEKRSRTGR